MFLTIQFPVYTFLWLYLMYSKIPIILAITYKVDNNDVCIVFESIITTVSISFHSYICSFGSSIAPWSKTVSGLSTCLEYSRPCIWSTAPSPRKCVLIGSDAHIVMSCDFFSIQQHIKNICQVNSLPTIIDKTFNAISVCTIMACLLSGLLLHIRSLIRLCQLRMWLVPRPICNSSTWGWTCKDKEF